MCPTGGFCYGGLAPNVKDECCSHTATSSGAGDFTELVLRAADDCDSTYAQAIVNGLCLGKESCNITVRGGAVGGGAGAAGGRFALV